MASKDGGPAFPGYTMEDDGERVNVTKLAPGMTLRDHFASHAMMGLFVQQSILEKPYKDSREKRLAFARVAYDIADAMLAAREKEPT